MFSLGAIVSFQSVRRTDISILNFCAYFLRAHIKFAFDFSFQRIQERERDKRERERERGREREKERVREGEKGYRVIKKREKDR